MSIGPKSTSWARALGLGGIYGVFWWVLGALLIMPLWLGMLAFQLGQVQLQSLAGHIVYGIALAGVLHAMALPARTRKATFRA